MEVTRVAFIGRVSTSNLHKQVVAYVGQCGCRIVVWSSLMMVGKNGSVYSLFSKFHSKTKRSRYYIDSTTMSLLMSFGCSFLLGLSEWFIPSLDTSVNHNRDISIPF